MCFLSQGSGTTVVVEELESQAGAVDLGPQFVGRPFTRDFSLRNMSRRPQQITWIAVTRDAIIRNRTRVPKKVRAEAYRACLLVLLFEMIVLCYRERQRRVRAFVSLLFTAPIIFPLQI